MAKINKKEQQIINQGGYLEDIKNRLDRKPTPGIPPAVPVRPRPEPDVRITPNVCNASDCPYYSDDYTFAGLGNQYTWSGNQIPCYNLGPQICMHFAALELCETTPDTCELQDAIGQPCQPFQQDCHYENCCTGTISPAVGQEYYDNYNHYNQFVNCDNYTVARKVVGFDGNPEPDFTCNDIDYFPLECCKNYYPLIPYSDLIPYSERTYDNIGGIRTKNPLIINADIRGLSKIDCMIMHSIEMGFPATYGPGEYINSNATTHPFTPELYHILNSAMFQKLGSTLSHQFHCMIGNAACHYHEETTEHLNTEMNLTWMTPFWVSMYPWLADDGTDLWESGTPFVPFPINSSDTETLPGSLHAGSRYSVPEEDYEYTQHYIGDIGDSGPAQCYDMIQNGTSNPADYNNYWSNQTPTEQGWTFTPCSHTGLLGIPIYSANNPNIQLLNYYNKDGYSVGACESFGSLHRDDWNFNDLSGDEKTMMVKIWDHCTNTDLYYDFSIFDDIDLDFVITELEIRQCFIGSILNHILCDGTDYSNELGIPTLVPAGSGLSPWCPNDQEFNVRGILKHDGLPSLPGIIPCDYTYVDANESVCEDINTAFVDDDVDIGLFNIPLAGHGLEGDGKFTDSIDEMYNTFADMLNFTPDNDTSLAERVLNESGDQYYFDNPACAHGNCYSNDASFDNKEEGCTNFGATNYNPDANVDNGSCEFSEESYVPQETFLDDMIEQHRKIKFSIDQNGKLFQTNRDFWNGAYPYRGSKGNVTQSGRPSTAITQTHALKFVNHTYNGEYPTIGHRPFTGKDDPNLFGIDMDVDSGSMDRIRLYDNDSIDDNLDAWNDGITSDTEYTGLMIPYKQKGSLFWNKGIHVGRTNWIWNGGICDDDNISVRIWNERLETGWSDKANCVVPRDDAEEPLPGGEWKHGDWYEFKSEDIATSLWSAINSNNNYYHKIWQNGTHTYPNYPSWQIMGNEMFLGSYPTEDGITNENLSDVVSDLGPLAGYGLLQRIFYDKDTFVPRALDSSFFSSMNNDDFGCGGFSQADCLEYPFGSGENSHLHCTWTGEECILHEYHQLNYPYHDSSVTDSLITDKGIFPSLIMWTGGFYKANGEWIRDDNTPPDRPYFNEFATVNELMLHQPLPGDFENWKTMLNKLQPYEGNEDDVWSLPNWEIYDNMGIGIQAHVYTETGLNMANTLPAYNFDGYSIYEPTGQYWWRLYEELAAASQHRLPMYNSEWNTNVDGWCAYKFGQVGSFKYMDGNGDFHKVENIEECEVGCIDESHPWFDLMYADEGEKGINRYGCDIDQEIMAGWQRTFLKTSYAHPLVVGNMLWKTTEVPKYVRALTYEPGVQNCAVDVGCESALTSCYSSPGYTAAYEEKLFIKMYYDMFFGEWLTGGCRDEDGEPVDAANKYECEYKTGWYDSYRNFVGTELPEDVSVSEDEYDPMIHGSCEPHENSPETVSVYNFNWETGWTGVCHGDDEIIALAQSMYPGVDDAQIPSTVCGGLNDYCRPAYFDDWEIGDDIEVNTENCVYDQEGLCDALGEADFLCQIAGGACTSNMSGGYWNFPPNEQLTCNGLNGLLDQVYDGSYLGHGWSKKATCEQFGCEFSAGLETIVPIQDFCSSINNPIACQQLNPMAMFDMNKVSCAYSLGVSDDDIVMMGDYSTQDDEKYCVNGERNADLNIEEDTNKQRCLWNSYHYNEGEPFKIDWNEETDLFVITDNDAAKTGNTWYEPINANEETDIFAGEYDLVLSDGEEYKLRIVYECSDKPQHYVTRESCESHEGMVWGPVVYSKLHNFFGDLNQDGFVDFEDASLLLNNILHSQSCVGIYDCENLTVSECDLTNECYVEYPDDGVPPEFDEFSPGKCDCSEFNCRYNCSNNAEHNPTLQQCCDDCCNDGVDNPEPIQDFKYPDIYPDIRKDIGYPGDTYPFCTGGYFNCLGIKVPECPTDVCEIIDHPGVNLNELQQHLADMNQDGLVNIVDYNELMNDINNNDPRLDSEWIKLQQNGNDWVLGEHTITLDFIINPEDGSF